MADSESSRTLSKISCVSEFPDEDRAEIPPEVINRRNLLPAAARILPMLLDEVPSRTVAGPFHIKELWPRWFDRYQHRLVAERESRDLEARLLKETGGRPCVVIETDSDASSSRTVSSFKEIRELAPRIGAEVAASARIELRRQRQAWNAADLRIGYSASLSKAQEIAQFEGIAGRILISLQPHHIHDIAAKLHYMLVNYDPDLRKAEAPWPYLRCMLRELIEPQWSVIDPQSRIRWLQPRKR
ncbi:hypothetical protein O8B93_25600 [Agrobacterium rhizogenes]|uniref:hypothetical protein n=1 Tax=Rhizobium rhizogenes TaxID=359 RepID=UPI0022B6A861|nr:hypothetical protein [Rhizobium rhizogenes]MCZ7450953.1 hypothetical protein [Rhizobium rhizogenes]